MYSSQILLFYVAIGLGFWVLILILVAYAVAAKNKSRRMERQRIKKMEQTAEERKCKMRLDAEFYERVGRYEEAAKLYEELGELGKANQCRARADYLRDFSQY